MHILIQENLTFLLLNFLNVCINFFIMNISNNDVETIIFKSHSSYFLGMCFPGYVL
jgi:hypothetical protein